MGQDDIRYNIFDTKPKLINLRLRLLTYNIQVFWINFHGDFRKHRQ